MAQNISTVCFRLLQSSNLKLSWFIGKLELRELNCFFKKIRIRNVERWWFYIKFLRKAFATFLEASEENWREKILDLNENIGTADGDESSVVYQCSPSWIFLFKGNNGNTRAMREICSQTKRPHWLGLSLFLTSNIFDTLFWCWHCWLWTSKCWQGRLCLLGVKHFPLHRENNLCIRFVQ